MRYFGDIKTTLYKKRHWRLVAASLNAMSSKPLKGEELRKVIQDAWAIDGIRDTEEIAHKLNCTVQYVRKILKPVRSAEKEKLKKQVVSLKEDGLSNKEIAKKTGAPRTTVRRVISEEDKHLRGGQNETVSFWPPLKSEENPSNSEKTPPNSCTIPAESVKSNENSSISDKPPASDNSDHFISKLLEKVVENTGNTDSQAYENGTCSEMNHPKTEGTPSNSETTPSNSRDTTPEPEMPTEMAVSADTPSEPFSAIPDLTQFAGEEGWKPGEKTCLRAMELVRAKWNVKAIAQKLNKTEVWVRSTVVALIAAYQSKTDKHPHQDWTAEKIAQGLVITDDRVIYLAEFVRCWPGILPDREPTFYWMQENLPVYQNFTHVPEGSLLNIMSLEAVYRRSVREGKQPPWEKENPPRLNVIPQDIIDRSAGARTLFYDMADSVHQGLFDDIITFHSLKKIAIRLILFFV